MPLVVAMKSTFYGDWLLFLTGSLYTDKLQHLEENAIFPPTTYNTELVGLAVYNITKCQGKSNLVGQDITLNTWLTVTETQNLEECKELLLCKTQP